MPAISSVLTGCVNNTKANDNNDTLTYAKLLKTIPPNVKFPLWYLGNFLLSLYY